ncbi:MAG TPA: hypothetical protein VFV72_12070 [Candidatus Limnocylindrales bacterium]|nr:hypothetical protein [Candidatus Limnocylindrales bacterium]
MNERTLTDTQIKAAFIARSEGSIGHDLAERIHAETSRTRQASRLTVLPGGVGENPNVGRLLWAAAVSATSLALVGGLLLAGRQPDDQAVVPPSETPVATPSLTPEPTGNAAESPLPSEPAVPNPADPTATPANVDPYPSIDVDSAAVTFVGDLRVRSLPTVDPSSQKLEPLLPAGERLLVISEPVEADGYVWYHVMPFDSTYPAGWVAAGSREGEPWIGADDPSCPASPLDSGTLSSLGAYGGLACFGREDITVYGVVTCDVADVDYTINGPSWMSSAYACSFILDDSQYYFYLDGIAVEIPTIQTPYDVTGHFADAQASTCEWVFDPPAPDQDEIEAMCRSNFVATEWVNVPID